MVPWARMWMLLKSPLTSLTGHVSSSPTAMLMIEALLTAGEALGCRRPAERRRQKQRRHGDVDDIGDEATPSSSSSSSSPHAATTPARALDGKAEGGRQGGRAQRSGRRQGAQANGYLQRRRPADVHALGRGRAGPFVL